MTLRCGPTKIVALNCGKFSFAEIELDSPVHLIGANNVGKTSLISLLQFLYLDDQRHMHFSREMAETRRYYFPDKYSYALFECLTPTGFQVVGVRGLGPVRQHEFERFVYTGRFELSDYLDEQRLPREPEDCYARLAVKGFSRLEPRALRAALTGAGESHDVHLGLVPARHSGAYERFRKVFGNILRLAHVRQEELKQLLLDIYGDQFQQREIDLARNYAAGFEKVRRDSHEVQELKLLQGDIERVLKHLDRRDRAREAVPALWQAIGRTVTSRNADYERRAGLLREARSALEAQEKDLETRLGLAHDEANGLAGEAAVLKKNLSKLDEQRVRLQAFVADWARQRLADVERRQVDIAIKLRTAAAEPVERLQQRLRAAQQQLAAKSRQLENLVHALISQLRGRLDERELADAFSVLNPELLKLPVNTETPGIKADLEAASSLLRELLARLKGRNFEIDGVRLDLDAVTAPPLSDYDDPQRIREDLASLEVDIRRYSDALEAAEQADSLRKENEELDEEQGKLRRELHDYELFCVEAAHEPGWKEELARVESRQEAVKEQIVLCKRQGSELQEADRQNKSELGDVERQRLALTEQAHKLVAPPPGWPVRPLPDLPEDFDELAARYRKAFSEEQTQAEQAKDLLDSIEQKTYGRYAAQDEAATVQALREQLETIPKRKAALAEMWKGIAVGIRKDLQNIGRDLDTLKGLVGTLNRQMSSVGISNLASLKLLIEEQPQWAKHIRSITVDEELPLFSDPKGTELALEGIGRLLSEHPHIHLRDLFNLCFEVGTSDGKTHRHEHLDAIESNGTTVAIKVMVNLMLLRDLLGGADVQLPFYLDECSSLDQGNLTAIVNAARGMGFIAVLASPEAMDAADKLYFLEEQEGGRVIVDRKTSMLSIHRAEAASRA
jgi:hypothetical protein